MNKTSGFTLIELLVTIALIGIVIVALANTELLSLRTTSRNANTTVAKAANAQALETAVRKVLTTTTATVAGVSTTTYDFNKYWYGCGATPPVAPYTSSVCSYTDTATGAAVRIRAESGYTGEGILTITATTTQNGRTVVMLDRVTCYDVYPSPSRNAPAPCPTPASPAPTGSGA